LVRNNLGIKSNIMAKLKSLQTDIRVNANREKIWEVLFNQFSEINIYHPGTTDSRLTKGKNGEIGCQRVCQFGSKMSITENVVETIPIEKLAIDANGFPGVKDIMATFNLRPLGVESTEVAITFRYRTIPAILAMFMSRSMKKNLHQVLVGLKFYVETGRQLEKENFKSIYSKFLDIDAGKAFA